VTDQTQIECIDVAQESIEDIAAWAENPCFVALVDGIRRVITSISPTNGGPGEIINHTAVPLTGLLFKRRLQPHLSLDAGGIKVHLFTGEWDKFSKIAENHGPQAVKLVSLKEKAK
jgi:hypothetical protein